jgi:hypothetical protein
MIVPMAVGATGLGVPLEHLFPVPTGIEIAIGARIRH